MQFHVLPFPFFAFAFLFFQFFYFNFDRSYISDNGIFFLSKSKYATTFPTGAYTLNTYALFVLPEVPVSGLQIIT